MNSEESDNRRKKVSLHKIKKTEDVASFFLRHFTYLPVMPTFF